MKRKIALIGCGVMGTIIVKGTIEAGFLKVPEIAIFDIDRKKMDSIRKRFKVKCYPSADCAMADAGSVLIAVKPQHIGSLENSIKKSISSRHLLISVAAGVPIADFKGMTSKPCAVVRAMPNIACKVREGVIAIACSSDISALQKQFAVRLFSSLGAAVCVPERHIDAFTAISGSGPAYVFFLMEQMCACAEKTGMPKKLIKDIVARTVRGAASLAVQTQAHPRMLRADVTSRGGTTEAATDYLAEHNCADIMQKAFCAAFKRARDMRNKK